MLFVHSSTHGDLYILFGDISFQVLCPSFNWGVGVCLFYNLASWPLSDMQLQIFSFWGLSLYSLECPLIYKSFNFDEVQFVFSLVTCAFGSNLRLFVLLFSSKNFLEITYLFLGYAGSSLCAGCLSLH